MKKMERPEFEIVRFEKEDIIAASGCPTKDELPDMPIDANSSLTNEGNKLMT